MSYYLDEEKLKRTGKRRLGELSIEDFPNSPDEVIKFMEEIKDEYEQAEFLFNDLDYYVSYFEIWGDKKWRAQERKKLAGVWNNMKRLVEEAYENSANKGFWKEKNPKDVFVRLEKLALITEEVGEAVSAVRIDDNENLLEELADICIRVFDLAGSNDFDLEKAIIEKMNRNKKRDYMHGKLA